MYSGPLSTRMELGLPRHSMILSKLRMTRSADPAYLMRLSLEQSVGVTAANAIVECFGTPITVNELGWIVEIRDASDNADPRITVRSRSALRGIFGK